MRDSCCLYRSEKLEAGPEIWKAYYAGFPMEDHFAASISCSGVSTLHQSGTWQPPFPSSPRLMQQADTVQLFVSDCSLATQRSGGREGGKAKASSRTTVSVMQLTAIHRMKLCSWLDHEPQQPLPFAQCYGPEQGRGGRSQFDLSEKVLSFAFPLV